MERKLVRIKLMPVEEEKRIMIVSIKPLIDTHLYRDFWPVRIKKNDKNIVYIRDGSETIEMEEDAVDERLRQISA